MQGPSFTIVTPSLNQAAFIQDAIRSVKNQRYSPVEHIIVDGGSTDGTLEILKSCPHLRYVSEPDRGQAHALNKGFSMASGDILGWVNSDDYYCEGVFDRVAVCFQDPSVMVVYGNGYEVSTEGRVLQEIVPRALTPELLIRYWKWQYAYVQASFFFRRAALEAAGPLDEGLHYAMDHDLFIRLGRRFPLTYIPLPLACFRVHPRSKTAKVRGNLIPKYLWEMHAVSRRYWGPVSGWSFYEHTLSFTGALLLSLLKNLFFVPGSKSNSRVRGLFKASGKKPAGGEPHGH